jgi:argininosuccinate lyase
MEAAAADEFLGATDVADLLVRRGVPFRASHGIVAGLVRKALEDGRTLSQLTPEELEEIAPQLGEGLGELLDDRAVLESKVSEGGTSLERVREQITRARRVLSEESAV